MHLSKANQLGGQYGKDARKEAVQTIDAWERKFVGSKAQKTGIS